MYIFFYKWETTLSKDSSNASQHADWEKERGSESRSTKSLSELKLGSSQMKRRLKPFLDALKDYASKNDIEVTRL